MISCDTLPDWKVCFLRAEEIFYSMICALRETTPSSPFHMKWDIFKYIFQILRASLAVARMSVFLRAEDLQRALHTFLSGLSPSYTFVSILSIGISDVQKCEEYCETFLLFCE